MSYIETFFNRLISNHNRRRNFILATISLYIFIYLIIIKPFSIGDTFNIEVFTYVFLYSFFTFLYFKIIFFLLEYIEDYFPEDNKYLFIYALFIFLAILISSFSFYLLNKFVLDIYSREIEYIDVFLEFVIIALPPTVLFTAFVQRLLLLKHIEIADSINKSNVFKEIIGVENKEIEIFSDNKNNVLKLSLNDLICIEANDNYCAVYYFKNNLTTRELLRNTLKNIETDLSLEELMKCHKSYLVNILNIESVVGGTQGYKFICKGLTFEIPISRSFPREIIKKFK